LKTAVQATPREAGIALANWNGKVVREFVEERSGIALGHSSCHRYLHRLGFVLKRPRKRLLKADAVKREAFVRAYTALREEAQEHGARIFFVDEAHCSADIDLRGKWVLKGEPAEVDSTCPRWGEKASSYSAVCLETGEVDAMALDGNSVAETSTAFLRALRAKFPRPLVMLWDNSPVHGGDALRTYLATPDLDLRLVRLPAYSPDFNADEAIWAWIRDEVTTNTCFGTKAKVQVAVDHFFQDVATRTTEVKQRCRSALQAAAEALTVDQDACYVDSTVA